LRAGLPIELKVTEKYGLEKDKGQIDRQHLRALCRCLSQLSLSLSLLHARGALLSPQAHIASIVVVSEYADSWINNQAEDFKRLGVVADWDHRYTTMDPRYAATVLRVFGKFVHGGYVERKEKTVPWCSSCQTVLANAEIEYQSRVDPSCYVAFPLPAAYRDLIVSNGTSTFISTYATLGFHTVR
jgi:isoleucyl-tRNA synthetase